MRREEEEEEEEEEDDVVVTWLNMNVLEALLGRLRSLRSRLDHRKAGLVDAGAAPQLVEVRREVAGAHVLICAWRVAEV